MTHIELWMGIKNLANKLDLSCSGLAKLSGLDPTTFNQSRHKNQFGQNRWLTTYTLARVLDATGITLAQFAQFLPSDTHTFPRSPYIKNIDDIDLSDIKPQENTLTKDNPNL